MLPGMRFFIITIVSIFAALGIGIFIGFTMNTQDFVIEQNAILNQVIESQLEVLIEENRNLKARETLIVQENMHKDEYINLSYYHMLDNRLEGFKIGIIEASEDYINSGIIKDIELSGGEVVSITIINNNFLNKEVISDIFTLTGTPMPKNPISTSVSILTESIIRGEPNAIFQKLIEEGLIEINGRYDEELNYLIICGGGTKESSKRINQLDSMIVETAKSYNIPILGVEKSEVDFSYIQAYKDMGIPTVDNIDMTMGKVAMVLAIEGMEGNYGVKKTAESVIPNKIMLSQE